MEVKIDKGEVIVEEFADVSGANTVTEIYNRLYPYYCTALIKALRILAKRQQRR
jgi:methionyl-tRNA formyltransferase